ncbi:MAG: aminomethyl-transferring glycine dehydrogenase subunit GcvPA [Thermoproteota archaeon]
MHPWLPARKHLEEMLKAIGVSDPMELYSDVPPQLILKEPPKVGFGRRLSEVEMERIFASYMDKVRVFLDPPPFMGGGLCLHAVPSVVDAVISRAEFLTAYTPYQPEINQGLLQALFEYQSLVADLLEMDVVNASMYDMSTALAEAALMAMRVTKRRKVLVPSTMHPEHLQVLETWLSGIEAKVEKVDFDRETGFMDLDDLEAKIDDGTAAVYVEVPSYLGFIDTNVEAIGDTAHKHGALLIAGVDPLSLGIVKPPGRYGADIAVGEGQPLGLKLNYGGPLLGIFATRWDRNLVRQMPGRLIGLTRTVDGGERGFMMVLQTREQHIKREKATSNITTNEALMAVAAAVYLSLLGGSGLRRLAEAIWYKSHYAAKRLSTLDGVTAPAFSSPFFKEFTASFPKPYTDVHKKLLGRGILGGLALSGPPLHDSSKALFCVTEVHSLKDIDRLVDVLGEVL